MIAIFSDSHDNFANLEEFLKQVEQLRVDCLIHCGDVTTSEFLRRLTENFAGQIKLALGNAEIRPEEFQTIVAQHPNLEIFEEVGLYEAPVSLKVRGRDLNQNLKIAFTHKPSQAQLLAEAGQSDFVFYGHTHRPWISSGRRGVVIANPGTLGGVFFEPTYALLNPVNGQLALRKLFSWRRAFFGVKPRRAFVWLT